MSALRFATATPAMSAKTPKEGLDSASGMWPKEKELAMQADDEISRHKGKWSNAALVVDAIANGGSAKLALAAYGFKSDRAWARAMRKEFEVVLSQVPCRA